MSNIGRRRKRERNFVTIENSMFNDPALSFRAKGVLGYLLTKPDGWKVRVEDIAKRGKEGRDAIWKAIHELQALGYLHFYRSRNSEGYLKETIWEYDDIPTFEPHPENPDLENQDLDSSPNPENPNQVNPNQVNPNLDSQDVLIRTDSSNKDFSNTDNKNTLSPEDILQFKYIMTDFGFNAREREKVLDYLKKTKLEFNLEDLAYQMKVMGDYEYNVRKIDDYGAFFTTTFANNIGKYKNPSKPKRKASEPIRKELLPDWFENESSTLNKSSVSPEDEEKKRAIEEKLKAFRK